MCAMEARWWWLFLVMSWYCFRRAYLIPCAQLAQVPRGADDKEAIRNVIQGATLPIIPGHPSEIGSKNQNCQ